MRNEKKLPSAVYPSFLISPSPQCHSIVDARDARLLPIDPNIKKHTQ
jgi:hypothetical protein